MKNIGAIIFVWLVFSGCMKNDQACTPLSPASEEERIQAYGAANSMTLIRHSSGIFYQIMSSGYGATPDVNSKITIGYVGKFLDGYLFDQNSSISNYLKQFIEGWQIGLPLIKEGGTIRLVIPSAYAYGCTTYGNIPPNTILYFEVNLIKVE
jgi:FKBP-type peptidyl-prolyl cis-trans isomerase FkpA